MVRGDSKLFLEDLMTWCEANGMAYVLGLAQNARQVERLANAVRVARA